MRIRMSTLTSAELEELHGTLSRATGLLVQLGHYKAAAACKSSAAEASQHLLRREADHRQSIARQLSLTPPGAYDQP